jgi:hypothetical protein
VITGVLLSDPARGLSYQLLPNDSILVADIEFTATVRPVAEDQANADGTLDTTQWLGSGAVTVNMTVAGDGPQTIGAALDSVAAMLLPWARPYLVVTDDDWPSPRQVQLRFDSHSHLYESHNYRQAQLSWVAPRGLWEDTAQVTASIAASAADLTGLAFTDTAGVAVLATTGFRLPASTASGDTIVTMAGSARPSWTARMYGPATGPKLSRDDTGQSVSFKDTLVIAAGDYVDLDSAAKTARRLGDPDSSVLGSLDWAASEWFPLDPGPNQLRYHATSGTGPGTVCQVTAVPVWMP